MAQYASIWAIKTDLPHYEGDTVLVSLKSGKRKYVTLGALADASETKDGKKVYYYLPAKDQSTAEKLANDLATAA